MCPEFPSWYMEELEFEPRQPHSRDHSFSSIMNLPPTISIIWLLKAGQPLNLEEEPAESQTCQLVSVSRLKWHAPPSVRAGLLTSPDPMKFINCFWKNHLTQCPEAVVMSGYTRWRGPWQVSLLERGLRETPSSPSEVFWWFHFILRISLRICFDLYLRK